MDYNSCIEYEHGMVHLLDTFVYITVDPSGGASEATATARIDKCGWTVGAVNAKDERFIFEIGENHLTDEQFIDHVYRLNEEYLPKLIGIEKTPHLMSHFRKAEKERKVVLPLYELRSKGVKKSVRIRSSRLTLGHTYFLDGIQPKCQLMFRNWYDEMLHGDDGIDSFAYFDTIAVPPTVAQLTAHKQEVMRLIERNMLLNLPKSGNRDTALIRHLMASQRYSEDDDLESFNNGE